MKRFLILTLFGLIATAGYAQRVEVRGYAQTTNAPRPANLLDTNALIYDEQGKALKYHQYQKLINSGKYTITYTGAPNDVNSKRILKELTEQEQQRRIEVLKNRMVIKSPLLQEGLHLNFAPLAEAISEKYLENKVVVLVFWNVDCPPCVEGFASINEYVSGLADGKDLMILAVTADKWDTAAAKLKEKPLLGAKLISDAGKILMAYELKNYPSYVVADKEGIIRYATSGSTGITIPLLKKSIEAALMGKN